jgi:hypothetical protein
MSRTNYKAMPVANRTGLALTVALVLTAALTTAAPASAGEFGLAFRIGRDDIEVDGNRLSSGNSVNERMVNLGLLASYRWEKGGYIEAGIGGSGNFDVLGIQNVSHRWIGGGWQFDLGDAWKLTPKAGLTWSNLTSSEEDLFDSEPVDEFSDTVPFFEIALEHRFFERLGVGLYYRHTEEDWGLTRDAGLSLSWAFR